MTAYDKIGWHEDAAVEAGQPADNAFTHIGLYLAWLIRRDLHDPRLFRPEDVAAVKRGEMTGSDLADEIDGKLVADAMNREGRAFADARYERYLELYEETFADAAPYSVRDEAETFARIEPALDGLYESWVAEGRPKPERRDAEAELATTDEPGTWAARQLPGEPSRADIEAITARMAEELGATVEWVDEMEGPHEAPELEQLLARVVTDPALEVSSVSAADWGSSRLNRALKRLGVQRRDVIVVNGIGGSGRATVSLTLYRVPGIARDRLASEFEAAVTLPPRGKWRQSRIAGRDVKIATGGRFTVAYYAIDELVVHVAAEPAEIERILPLLP